MDIMKWANNAIATTNCPEEEKRCRLSVVEEALTWIGTPYHHMGRIKGAGVDCGMLIAEIFERCGLVPHVDVDYYPADWGLHRDEERYLRYVSVYCDPITRDVLPGDIILHRFGRCVSHGAIVLVGDVLLHSYINQGVLVAARSQYDLKMREYSCYSLKNWQVG